MREREYVKYREHSLSNTLRDKGSMRLFRFNSIDVAVNATIPVLIVVVIILFFGSSLFLPRLSVQRNT